MTCTRRDVLSGLAAGSALGVLGCGTDNGNKPMVDASGSGGMCGASLCLSLADASNAALASVGGAVIVPAPAPSKDTLIVIRTSASDVVALSDVCTHRSCALRYAANVQLLFCPCHQSEFDLAGQVRRGPAMLPLKVYPATIDAATNSVAITV